MDKIFFFKNKSQFLEEAKGLVKPNEPPTGFAPEHANVY